MMSVAFLPSFAHITGFLKHRGWLICRKASGEFPSLGGICMDLITNQDGKFSNLNKKFQFK
jgi:hypothetical protein